ncbi:MAG: 3'-5' exonuclease, partial [Clostridia bacterium]
IITFLESEEDEKDWIANRARLLYSKEGIDFCKMTANKKIVDIYEYFGKRLEETYLECQNFGVEKLCQHLYPFIEDIKKIGSENTFEKNYLNLHAEKTDKGKLCFKDEQFLELKEKVVKERDAFKKAVSSLEEKLNFGNIEIIDQLMQESREIIDYLINLYEICDKKYKLNKKNKRMLDFSDLEKLTIKLLESENVAAEIKNKYKYIFIDEYQDSNSVQEKIISKIAKENNRFIVGDVKQSIYGFRRSDPKIFLDIMDRYSQGGNSESHLLNANFRSDARILNFINDVFSVIMTKDVGGVDYAKNSLLNGLAGFPENDKAAVVDISVVAPEDGEKKCVAGGLYQMSQSAKQDLSLLKMQKEARIVAEKILETKLVPIYDKNIEDKRGVRFSDITILVRQRTGIDEFVKELGNCKIPTSYFSNANLMDEKEIRILANLMQVAINPLQDIALVSAIHSFFGRISNKELCEIKIAFPKEKFFYNSINLYKNQINDDISAKLIRFFEFLEQVKKIMLAESAYRAINFAINKSEFKEYLGRKKNGASKVQNVEKFLKILENKQDLKIFELLDFLGDENVFINASNFSNGEIDCVNIMTIHASKGLEFPIVFLVNAGQDLLKVPDREKIKINGELGCAIKSFDIIKNEEMISLQNFAIEECNKTEELSERIRLLYVALTRAKNRLFIVGTD